MEAEHKQAREQAYSGILRRTAERFHELEEHALPNLNEEIRQAAEFELAAADLAKDEVSLLSQYVKRDLGRLWAYVAETGRGLAEWLKFDRDLLEEQIAEALDRVADRTTVETETLRHRLESDQDSAHYSAGEVACGGSFACQRCGSSFVLHRVSQLHDCGDCGHPYFERISES